MLGTESSLSRRLMVLLSRIGKGCRAGNSTTGPASQKNGERGTELVEFALVFVPMLAMVFAIVNIAWIYFAKESLEHAVLAGIRFAVTGNVLQNIKGQDASIKSIVQDQAMGFLAGQQGLNKITINYYSPSNFSNTSKPVTGAGSNAGGNIVEIRVDGVTVSVLGPLLNGGPLAFDLSAISTDVMESSPGGVPPAR